MSNFKCSILVILMVFCCFIWQGESLSLRQRRSGTADQELFHLLEKMKHRPVAGIIDMNRIGKRQYQDNYPNLGYRSRQQADEELPISAAADSSSYFY